MKSSDYKSLSRYVSSYLGSLKTHSVSINDQEWKYMEGGKGETIVFIHGLMGSKVLWRSLMQHYVGKYRVISVDIPGLFVEQRLQDRKHNFRELANWLEMFLEHLQVNNAHLISHSTGCGLASYYAATRPSSVTSVALLNHPSVSPESYNSGDKGVVNGYMDDISLTNLDSIEAWNAAFVSMFYVPPKIPQVIQRYRYRAFQRHHSGFVQVLQEIDELKSMVLPYLRKMKCRVLIVNGAQDNYSSENFFQTLKNQVPSGQHIVLDKCGHMSFLEKPDQVMEHYQKFLNTTSPTLSEPIMELEV